MGQISSPQSHSHEQDWLFELHTQNCRENATVYLDLEEVIVHPKLKKSKVADKAQVQSLQVQSVVTVSLLLPLQSFFAHGRERLCRYHQR